jgi:hypothetical protein
MAAHFNCNVQTVRRKYRQLKERAQAGTLGGHDSVNGRGE